MGVSRKTSHSGPNDMHYLFYFNFKYLLAGRRQLLEATNVHQVVIQTLIFTVAECHSETTSCPTNTHLYILYINICLIVDIR